MAAIYRPSYLPAMQVLKVDGGRGIQDFVCCQGYIGKCCCIDPKTFCPGSPIGLCFEVSWEVWSGRVLGRYVTRQCWA